MIGSLPQAASIEDVCTSRIMRLGYIEGVYAEWKTHWVGRERGDGLVGADDEFGEELVG